MLVKSVGVILGLALVYFPVAHADGEPSYDLNTLTASQAYEEGKILRAQFKNMEARPYLQYAAEKGSASAAYLYAMELTKYNSTVRTPAEAREYLETAAKLGNLQAMEFLYENGIWLRPQVRQTWKRRFHDSLILLAEKYPAEAMYQLALFYAPSDIVKSTYYLDKSVSYQYDLAIMEKARRYQYGTTNSAVNTQLALSTYLIAANHGFIPGMKACIEMYEAQNDFQSAYLWREKAFKAGDITSLAVLAKIATGESGPYDFVKRDLVKAHAYAELYLDYAGSDRLNNLHKKMELFVGDITLKMTQPELADAKVLAESYKSEHILFYNHDIFWDI
jgi:TPR repeat protein